MPSGLFTIGLFFLPESPRFLAFQRIRQERERTRQGLHSPSRFPPDVASPYAFHDIPDVAPFHTPPDAYVGLPPDTAVLSKAVMPEAPDASPQEIRSAIDDLFKGLFDPRNQADDPLAPIRTLAYLRNVPIHAASLKAEMAEIYAQMDEAEEDRARGRTHWRALMKMPSVRKRMAIGGFMGAWQIWTAQNAILYYA